MNLRKLSLEQKEQYNSLVTHVIQSWEWGDFRQKLGTEVERYGLYHKNQLKTAFQLTFHPIPFTTQTVGYLPKGPLPDKNLAQALTQIALEKRCAFIKVEPNVLATAPYRVFPQFLPSPKPLFTKYNFLLDLTLSEDLLLQKMHPKTRYNIRLAQKKGVIVQERFDDQALEIYLHLYFMTTKRQKFYGHNETYHRLVWQTLKEAKMARFLIGFYQNEPLVAWMLLNFHDTLYYPYGGSSDKHREVMASNLVAWEAIKLGKRLGLKTFDFWGALGPEANPDNPWYGFHRFKKGYGGELVEYLGTYDLVFNSTLYYAFNAIDKMTPVKIALLKMLGR